MDNTLKPCPNCGSTKIGVTDVLPEPNCYTVHCEACALWAPSADSEGRAILNWNRIHCGHSVPQGLRPCEWRDGDEWKSAHFIQYVQTPKDSWSGNHTAAIVQTLDEGDIHQEEVSLYRFRFTDSVGRTKE